MLSPFCQLFCCFSTIFIVLQGFPRGTTEDPWKAPWGAAECRGQSAEFREKTVEICWKYLEKVAENAYIYHYHYHYHYDKVYT